TSGRSGQMLGGLVADGGSENDGPTTGQIKFRATIQEAYSDDYPSGDPYLDENDAVHNAVTIRGDLLDVTTCGTGTCLATTGFSEEDTSGATVRIDKGPLSKEIYAVNGVVGAPATQIAPGDDVTYRFQATLLIGDYEQLKFTDYLPLPIFKVSDPDADGAPGPAWSFDGSAAATPPAGQWKRGPNDTAYVRSGIVPTVTVDATSNYLLFDYGVYDDTLNTAMTVDILFTVRVSADPFADGLFLTNQVRKSQQNTQEEPCARDAIIQVQLTEPVLNIKKGVVATDAPNGIFSPTPVGPVSFTAPGSACPRFSGTISSDGLASTPIDSNLSGVDAGDKVTFAIVLENTGMGLRGAFDVRVRDSLPAGLTFVPGSLCVVDGTGAAMPYTTLGTGLFDPAGGLELTDPGPTATPEGALDPYHPTSGRNIAIILYDAQLTSAVRPLENLVNTATLYHYAGVEGGPDHTLTDRTDTATVSVAAPRAGKQLVGTEINLAPNDNTEAVIGEMITYTLRVTIPEGTTPNATIVDTLDDGLAFVDFVPGFT
ncbi:MAG: hypothetical protein H5T66_10280, partial [Chloroflexi bacterium]|nr:hypothetical protein [Chloroflexota bacterium]